MKYGKTCAIDNYLHMFEEFKQFKRIDFKSGWPFVDKTEPLDAFNQSYCKHEFLAFLKFHQQ